MLKSRTNHSNSSFDGLNDGIFVYTVLSKTPTETPRFFNK